jgi:hypothetical protein
MGEERDVRESEIKRPPRAIVSEKEALKRMREFPKRRTKFVASVRAGKR